MNNKAEDYVSIPKNKINNKNVLITGSTSGIGKEAAKALGRMGANVYIHGRNKEKGDEIVNYLKETVGTKSKFYQSDFSKLQEVNATVEMIKEDLDELDILINNAGGFFRGNKTGTNGIEYTFVVNYLSGFSLTLQLLPLLSKSEEKSHIIFTSSSAHKFPDKFNMNGIRNNTNNWNSYSRSKLAYALFSKTLHKKLSDETIITTAVHPGVILGSNFLRSLPGPIHKIGRIANYLPVPGLSSEAEGGAALINPINNSKHSGVYYNKFNRRQPSDLVQNIDIQKMLWDYSLSETGIDDIEL